MDMQTDAMLKHPEAKPYVTVGEHAETGKHHGLLYGNHPTPSGSERWMLLVSDPDGYDTEEEALAAMRVKLDESEIKYDDPSEDKKPWG